MAVGNLGEKIIFEVSDEKILTFRNASRTVKGKWQQHEIILSKPKQEFLGPELQSFTFSIDLNISLGIKPIDVINTIADIIEKGQPQAFVVGGRQIGNDLWVISSMTEAWNKVLTGGQIMSASIDLTLDEYLREEYYAR